MANLGTGSAPPRIWLDLATPPQVLFFEPVVSDLQERGAQVLVTARDFGATVSLARARGYTPDVIGGGTGARPWAKLARTIRRALSLRRWSHLHPCALAVSYNSYAQAVAARLQQVPLVTLMDFEYQPANRWCFRLAQKVVVPEAFDRSTIESLSVRNRVVTHPGLKEHVYLSPDNLDPTGARTRIGLEPDEPFILVRAPADFALYHQFQNRLFNELLRDIITRSDAHIVLSPRTAEQRNRMCDQYSGSRRLFVLSDTVDGPSLIAAAAAVVTAGGTMAREAAVMGVPAFSVFGGRVGGVDRWLEREGRLVMIASRADLNSVQWSDVLDRQCAREPWVVPAARPAVVEHIWNALS